LTFGLDPIELDPTEFVTNELTNELFASLIEPSLKEQNQSGIFRNLFPYLVDTICRTIPITRLVNYIQAINEDDEVDDIYKILQCFEGCTVPTNSFSKILSAIVAANIPIPIYLSNDTHSQKGLKVLNGMRDIIATRNYHLFISVNRANTDLEIPFTKQLYKNYSNNREDSSGICNPNSIDLSFHAASENHSRPPLAISENDFDGNELDEQFISTINDISVECHNGYKRRILILFWGVKPQFFNEHKENVETLLTSKFTNDEFMIELVLNDDTEDFLSENDFAISMAELEQFTCRADILYASYCSNEIEKLQDKTRFKTSEDSRYQTEGEINLKIRDLQNEQKNIVDFYFKDYLISLEQKAEEIKNTLIESDRSNIQRKELKQKIEDLDITIHDFWREFIILSQIMIKDDLNTIVNPKRLSFRQLEKAYSIWIREGEAIQILEGASLRTINSDFLSSVLSKIISNSKQQLIVLSVIGLEKLDVLIIDSEGMGSTAAKYISRRTDFDKKMTLLGFMCSQILIVNTKGLTRDISDTLEVSSYHLDALSNRNSKPRISFVLRDMKDAKHAQSPAFKNIRDDLKKMFDEIPGGSHDIDDFMVVEEQDVHLLENAFACSFDDFYPQSMLTDSENFHYPAETFPLKISKLRKELLNSALIPSENHESQIFKNIHGKKCLVYAQEIDERGNFLHFKDSKTIQQWSAMKKLVYGYNDTTVKSYKENGQNLIEEQASKGQWNENNDIEFETFLAQETEFRRNETIADFKEKVSNQYEAQIIDEGETHIKTVFAVEKQKLKELYAKRQRQSKESWLIKSAQMRIGETVGKILREHKDKTPEEFKSIFSESKCKELFNMEWKKVENDKENFMCTIIKKTKELEQHVVDSFNQAIAIGRAISNNAKNENTSKERTKFNRAFWNKVSTPATLNKFEICVIDTQEINIKINYSKGIDKFLNAYNKITDKLLNDIPSDNSDKEKNDFKNNVLYEIKTEIANTCEQICDDLSSQNALAIEFNQALEWLKSLCNNIFIVQNQFNDFQDLFKVKVDDFSSMEQYLRFKVFIVLESNTKKWKATQHNNLNNLREALLKSFYDILSNSSYENLSSQFFKYVSKSVEKYLTIQEEYIPELLEEYLKKKHWMSDARNPTRYVYEQSFGDYDVEKTRKYIHDPILFMKELFENEVDDFEKKTVDQILEKTEKDINDALEKLCEIMLICQQRFSGSSEKNLPLEKIINCQQCFSESSNKDLPLKKFIERVHRSFIPASLNKTIYPKILIEDAMRVLGKCIIDSPQDFFVKLSEEYYKYVKQFNTLWKTQRADLYKKTLIDCIENSKKSYWNKPENFKKFYCRKVDDDYENELKFEKYVKTYHPEWWPLLGRKKPDDDQIKQVRAMWVHLKDEICRKFDMVDKTPENWYQNYKHLAKLVE
ncbi:14980_t:CDS:10, partial [Racocetra fulgida]